jgi:hypothetical protein
MRRRAVTTKETTMTIKGTYTESEHFKIIDSIGVPHPYCITPKHVEVASDSFGGMLGEAAIEAAEKKGAHCGMRSCQLSFKQHEQALIVECRAPLKINGEANPELHKFLLDNKAECEKNNYAGFAFLDKRE